MNSYPLSPVDNLLNPGEAASQTTRMLAAAGRVFIEHGYNGASMEEIAKAAAVTRQTLYNRYPDGKEALFMAVATRLWRAFPATAIAADQAAMADPRKGLRQIAIEFAGFWSGSLAADLLRMVVLERRRFPNLASSFDEATQAPTMTVISDYLAELGRRGVLTVEDPQAAAKRFILMINGQVLWVQTMCDGTPLTLGEIEQLVDVTVDGFLRIATSPSSPWL